MEKTSDALIEHANSLNYIDLANPSWWDMDYPKDPREIMSYVEFESRLKMMGKSRIHRRDDPRNIGFYVGKNVPVTVLNIEIEGTQFPFFVTARPATMKESANLFIDRSLQETINGTSETEINQKIIEKGLAMLVQGNIPISENHLPLMYLPHVRGIFKEQRGNRFFYYPLRFGGNPDIPSYKKVDLALRSNGKEHILAWECNPDYFGPPALDHLNQAVDELILSRKVLIKRNKRGAWKLKSTNLSWPGLEHVPYDRFIPGETDIVSYYPVRPEGFVESIPFALASRSHPQSKANKGKFLVGVFGNYSPPRDKYPANVSVIPFTNEEFARDIAEKIKKEMGIKDNIRPVVLDRAPGKCEYRIMD